MMGFADVLTMSQVRKGQQIQVYTFRWPGGECHRRGMSSYRFWGVLQEIWAVLCALRAVAEFGGPSGGCTVDLAQLPGWGGKHRLHELRELLLE